MKVFLKNKRMNKLVMMLLMLSLVIICIPIELTLLVSEAPSQLKTKLVNKTMFR